ncbi:MAG: hydantoinase B/oxoprolinase family protein [Spirochaetes bacterium]|nr:hydantoinase B/oxoprolinase family protein [Spirochaetota bacterium]
MTKRNTAEKTKADPITVEVVRNYFSSTALQMGKVLLRASFNPVIYEMKDFTVGIYDKNYELISQDLGEPLFNGALSMATRDMVNYIGKKNLVEGDTLLSSYAFDTGSHPNDVTMVTPVFIDGEIFVYLTSKAHWMDIGGKSIYMSDSTEMYQEGLLLRSVKIKKAGVINEEIADIIRINSRFIDNTIGDMNAQLAAGEYGRKMVLSLVEKYGKDVVDDALVEVLNHGERLTRDIIRSLPDGQWSAEGALDDDGINIGVPVPVKLTVTIKGDEMIFDTTGSSGMTEGPMNCPLATTVSFITLIAKALLTPNYSNNGGCTRPIKYIVPEGSLFNPKPPASVCLYGWSGICLYAVGMKALTEAIPDRVVARSGNDIGCVMFYTKASDGSMSGGGIDECQGQGAWQGSDGTNALCDLYVGDSCNVPGEIIEERYPFIVERYSLRNNSGGPGEFRGGLGVEKHLKALGDVNLVVCQEQTKTPAWGLFGGKPSTMSMITVLRPETEHEWRTGKATDYKLPKGERMWVLTGGGGGWGDPYKRDMEKVLADVIDEYVSIESAKDDYGVAIKQEGDRYLIDKEETERIRGS